MTCVNLKRSFGIWVILCVQVSLSSSLRSSQDFQNKVSLLLREEPKNPKCFTQERKDFTCFWEEDEEPAGHVGQYSFDYAYEQENGSRCPLRTQRTAAGRTLVMCHLNRTQMFVQMYIEVRRDGVMIHSRSLMSDLVFLLDPPANLSVARTEQQDQLHVSWLPPGVKYMDDSMMYQVRYAPAPRGRPQVQEVTAKSEALLRDLTPGTLYTVQARVMLDGISYGGYWSAWTHPVSMETPPGEFNLLIVFLVAIISVIVFLLSVCLILSHQRFIKKKIWPAIPNAESKFQGLFTVYGGDFREWLGHTSGNLWLRPAFFSSEEHAAPLEVLSELSLGPQLSLPPLPPKASRPAEQQGEAEKPSRQEEGPEGPGALRETTHDRWLMEQLRAFRGPSSQASLLESQDAYVTLDAQRQASLEGQEPLGDIMEESSPLEVLFASSESRSDLGSMRRSSGSGGRSSRSSLDCCGHTWTGYTYMAVADSGVSMDYSHMGSGQTNGICNEYKNDAWSKQRPALAPQVKVDTVW